MANARDRRDFESQRLERHGDYAATKWYSLRDERDRGRDRPLERRRSDNEANAVIVRRDTIPRDDGSILVRETVEYRDRDRDREDSLERDRGYDRFDRYDRPGGRASSRVRFASPPREWDRDRRENRDLRDDYREFRDRDGSMKVFDRNGQPIHVGYETRFVDDDGDFPDDRDRERDRERERDGYMRGGDLIPHTGSRADDYFDRYGRRDRENRVILNDDAFDRYGNNALYNDRYRERDEGSTTIRDDDSFDRESEHFREIRRPTSRYVSDRYAQDNHYRASHDDVYHHDDDRYSSATSRPGVTRSRSMSLPPPPQAHSMKKIQIVTAMKPYKGKHTGDLTLVEGDLVRVTAKHGRHWLIGVNVDTKAQGFFPKDNVEGYESEEDELDWDPDVRDYREEPSASVSERTGAGGYTATVMVSNVPHRTELRGDSRSTVMRDPAPGYRRPAPMYH